MGAVYNGLESVRLQYAPGWETRFHAATLGCNNAAPIKMPTAPKNTPECAVVDSVSALDPGLAPAQSPGNQTRSSADLAAGVLDTAAPSQPPWNETNAKMNRKFDRNWLCAGAARTLNPTRSRGSVGGSCYAGPPFDRGLDRAQASGVLDELQCGAHRVGVGASPRASNEIIVPKPFSRRRAASWVAWLAGPG